MCYYVSGPCKYCKKETNVYVQRCTREGKPSHTESETSCKLLGINPDELVCNECVSFMKVLDWTASQKKHEKESLEDEVVSD